LISIRTVQPGDGAFMLSTTQELGRSHGWLDAMTATAERFENALFKSDPIIGALIAEVDGKLAGSALWHRSFSTARGEEVMYLEDLVVLPDFRRVGVADALMKEVAKVAISRGYNAIFWMMMAWNNGARAFYEKIGAKVEDGNCYCLLSDRALEDFAA
jgi:GNAT superfamily N-acetyltransferase